MVASENFSYDTIFFIDSIGTHLSEVLCGTGILANFILILLILTKTPKYMKSYAILLLNFAFFDFWTCLASLFACQKTIFSGFSLTYIFHGPCKFFGPSLCYFCHCFVCHSMAHSQWILLFSFIYRWRILKEDVMTIFQMIAASFAVYSCSFVVFLFYFLDRGDSNELLKIMSNLHPTYHYTNKTIWGNLTVSGNLTIFSLPSVTAIVYMTLPCVPIYVAIHYLRRKTLAILSDSENTLNISQLAKTSHRKLVKALTIQATIPIFWLVASLIFTLAEFGIISGPIPEVITFRLMDCIPMLTPIVSMFFIAPYREGLVKVLRKSKVPIFGSEPRAQTVIEATTARYLGEPRILPNSSTTTTRA
ncbi:unnamed protein product [Caenorhabditis angaria]|uniref:G-protein coupled receptors family 1 profile domain-containing protein n=1 Tax=Caenorhabditis angaria TaxID=860376 RepID=A0A9P1IKT0_9PELO|nr:unnamed protein product [Caenorhabditis angaria]